MRTYAFSIQVGPTLAWVQTTTTQEDLMHVIIHKIQTNKKRTILTAAAVTCTILLGISLFAPEWIAGEPEQQFECGMESISTEVTF